MKKLFSLAVAILFLFNGCMNSVDLPKWYVSSTKDNTKYIYGTGEGSTKQSAVVNALNVIASKINVKISSEFTAQKSMIESNGNTSFYRNVDKNIKVNVNDLTIYDYEVVKTANIDGKYYVLVKVDRHKNAELLFNRILNDYNKLKKSLSIVSSPIDKTKTYKKAVAKIDEMITKLYIVDALDGSMHRKVEKVINEMSEFEKKLQKSLKNISFNVISKDTKLKQITQNILSKFNFNISRSGNIDVVVQNTPSDISSVGNILHVNKVVLKLNDNQKTLTSSITCVGKSIDKELAESLSYKECKKRIEKKLKEVLLNN